MTFKTGPVILLTLICAVAASALEPDEILVVSNKDIADSGRIARHYCKKRRVPDENTLALSLGADPDQTIRREAYEKLLAEPIRRRLLSHEPLGKIRCLLTTYGVPIKVTGRGPLPEKQGNRRELSELAEQERERIERSEQDGPADSAQRRQRGRRLAQLQLEMDRIDGKQTSASVDSELSMVLFDDYELFRWQPNLLRNDVMGLRFRTLMVSRLDGPDCGIAMSLVDKAIAAEKAGLKGTAYIDSRGIVRKDAYGHFDKSLRDLATLTKSQTKLPVRQEQTAQLFGPGSCPRTALYCGWYSLKKYVDAFDFIDGAIGYHIASFEAANLRDPNSSQWCASMLRNGITATLGAVAEPYLHSFPEPKEFFMELYNGHCLVEAYYRTKPFNSWQLLLVGDPLYRPFKKNSEAE
ncbi:MAG: TIGR03790 family protein [Planctomycetota bacterium]|jgi:uncharacterized protein (TIGR03790 family)